MYTQRISGISTIVSYNTKYKHPTHHIQGFPALTRTTVTSTTELLHSNIAYQNARLRLLNSPILVRVDSRPPLSRLVHVLGRGVGFVHPQHLHLPHSCFRMLARCYRSFVIYLRPGVGHRLR